MKITELIKELQKTLERKGDINVYLQCDQEGNSYEAVRGASSLYMAESDGEYYFMDTVKDARDEMGFKRDELTDVVLVWP